MLKEKLDLRVNMEVEVIYTQKIHSYLTDAISNDTLPVQNDTEIKRYCDKFDELKSIPFNIIKKVYIEKKKQGVLKPYLNELLEESDMCLPEVKLPPRNPELDARIQKLKAEQANREYHQMTRNVVLKQKHESVADFGKEVKALNRHLWLVINFLFTVGGAFAFGYKATEYALGTASASQRFMAQMVIGLVFSTLVFFADLYFLLKETGT